MTFPTLIWLVRHGETDWNAQKRLQGWTDIPLNTAGVQQASRLAPVLHARLSQDSPHGSGQAPVIISSDLERAEHTARLATAPLDLPILTDARLRERCYGELEGHPWNELTAASLAQSALTPPGESKAQFHQRIVDTFEDLARQHAGRHLMVFSHGGVIDSVWRRLHDMALQAPRDHVIRNTSLHRFHIQAVQWQPIAWDDSAHLDEAALDDVTVQAAARAR